MLSALKASSLVYFSIAIMIFFPPHIYSVLTDDGICINGNITLGNKTQIRRHR